MKERTTMKYIKQNYKKIINVGYCKLQNFLKHETPKYYTAGVYGWNADIYIFKGIALVTGYRPFGNIEIKSNILDVIENKSKRNDLDVYETLTKLIDEINKLKALKNKLKIR